MWLWTGDAIYPYAHTPDGLAEGYTEQLMNEGYQRLLQSGVRVDGTYDDHDYGLNDYGRKFEPALSSLPPCARMLLLAVNHLYTGNSRGHHVEAGGGGAAARRRRGKAVC